MHRMLQPGRRLGRTRAASQRLHKMLFASNVFVPESRNSVPRARGLGRGSFRQVGMPCGVMTSTGRWVVADLRMQAVPPAACDR